MTRAIDRRTMLRAATAAVALPWLEAMSPAVAAASPSPPKRILFIYMPNGVNVATWFPKLTGTDYELTPSLEPLAKVKSELTLVSGLDRTMAPGTAAHAQSGACWLSSAPPTSPKDGLIPTDLSLDQMIAMRVGADTAFPSLELSCNDHADNKETKHFESVSWLAPGFAAGVEKDPRAVFDRLFGTPVGDPALRSVLDTMRDDARALSKDLGASDRRKLDEYLESVRATERVIQRAERRSSKPQPAPIPRPESIPTVRGEYIRLMLDLVVLAFQQDLTRVATVVLDPERWDSPRMYHGVFKEPQNHHVLTHTKGPEAKEKVARIDRFHVEQFAHVVEKLKACREGSGTLLDSTAAVLGSGISDGDSHSYSDLPVVLAGRAGGCLTPGKHLSFEGQRPLADLWLQLARCYGVDIPRFAESTGPLPNLS